MAYQGRDARKALNRLGIVLKHAAALGLDVDLQATEKAKALLGKSRHVATNIPAMAWADVPDFYASLEEPTLMHLALRLLILTGVRSKPLRHIRLDQIEGDVWTVPGEGMKGRKGATQDYRVPLSTEALRVIELARPHARNGFLFPSVRKAPAERPVSQVSQVSQRPRARKRKPRAPLGPIGWTPTRAHISTGCAFTDLRSMAPWQVRWAGVQRGLDAQKPSFAHRV